MRGQASRRDPCTCSENAPSPYCTRCNPHILYGGSVGVLSSLPMPAAAPKCAEAASTIGGRCNAKGWG